MRLRRSVYPCADLPTIAGSWPRIGCENQRGLPEVYNERIVASDAGDILVFVHDDVWIDDNFFGTHVVEGLRDFDVIGVAGNRRRVAKQPSGLCQS